MQLKINKNNEIEYLLYLSIFAATFGSAVVKITLFGVSFSLFRVSILLATAVGLVKLYLNNRKLIIAKPGNNYSMLFMLIWFAYALVTFIWAKNFSAWLKACFFIFVGVLSMLLLVNEFTEERQIINSFKALSLGSAIQAIIGTGEVITGVYHFVPSQYYYNYVEEKLPVAMRFNVNDFAMLMLIGAISSYIALKNTRNKILKILYIIIISDCIYLIIASKSRGAILALLLALAIWLLLIGKTKWLMAIAIGIVLLYLPQSFIKAVFGEKLVNVEHSRSDYIRVNLIKNGFDFLIKTLFFGVGAGQIEYWMAHYRAYNTSYITNMHNWWMEILAAYGVGIFIMYVVFYIKLFADALKEYRLKLKNNSLPVGICALLVGFAVACISSSSNVSNETMWVLFAILIAWQGLDKGKQICTNQD